MHHAHTLNVICTTFLCLTLARTSILLCLSSAPWSCHGWAIYLIMYIHLLCDLTCNDSKLVLLWAFNVRNSCVFRVFNPFSFGVSLGNRKKCLHPPPSAIHTIRARFSTHIRPLGKVHTRYFHCFKFACFLTLLVHAMLSYTIDLLKVYGKIDSHINFCHAILTFSCCFCRCSDV